MIAKLTPLLKLLLFDSAESYSIEIRHNNINKVGHTQANSRKD